MPFTVKMGRGAETVVQGHCMLVEKVRVQITKIELKGFTQSLSFSEGTAEYRKLLSDVFTADSSHRDPVTAQKVSGGKLNTHMK